LIVLPNSAYAVFSVRVWCVPSREQEGKANRLP
jgi:hypothetical protein